MSEELRKIIEHILTGYPSIDEGMGEVKQWAMDCVPKERQFTPPNIFDIGFNKCRAEMLKKIEEE